MNKFNVGDWVVHQDLVDYRCFDVPCSTPIDIYKIEKVDDCSIWVCGLRKDYDLFRQATVLDYIRTLDAEQFVKGYAKVGYAADCGHCIGCSDEYSCMEGKIQWLNQPLTDEIIKQLGGVEE